MSGKRDEIIGRVKEAAGVLTNDAALEREGKIDRATGKLKQAVEKTVDKVREVVAGSKKKVKRQARDAMRSAP